VLILILFIGPLVAGGVNFVIALFVVFPIPLITIPYLVMALYLSSSKKTRRIDIPIIIVSVMILLSLLSPGAYVILSIFLPFIMFSTPFGLFLIPILVVVLAVALRRGRKRGRKAEKPVLSKTAMFACPHCGRDLSALPGDIIICPYCCRKLVQQTCLGCGKDLSQFPVDIRNCPYCGKAVSTREEAVSVKAKLAKVEPPESVRRIRRYAKTAALLGLLIAIASFIIGPFLGGLMGPEHTYMFPLLHEFQNEIGNGVFLGVLIIIFSAIVRFTVGLARAALLFVLNPDS